jgi:hypothetical protein
LSRKELCDNAMLYGSTENAVRIVAVEPEALFGDDKLRKVEGHFMTPNV